MNILIIEDDPDLSAAIADYLEFQGATCDFAFNGESGAGLAVENTYDVIILDLMLPKLNGMGVCRTIRKHAIQTPVLMLTASGDEADQLKGFDYGIDDFITKPCSMPLLWARLQALYKRTQPLNDELLIGPLCIHLAQQRVIRGNAEIKLTPTEWRILKVLVKRFPNVVSRSEIEEYVWQGKEVDQKNFNVHLHGLRKAIDKPFDKPLIRTVVNVGIRLDAN